MDPLTVTQIKFFTFWDAKCAMILPMLERLKQSSVFDLITINVNTDVSERKTDCDTEAFSFTLCSRLPEMYWWLGGHFIWEVWNTQTT